jgi:NAD+ synthase
MPEDERAAVARPAPPRYSPAMTAPSFRLALAQVNPTVGDIAGNTARIRETRRQAGEAGADLVMLPELVLCGAPPEDLLRRSAFRDACRRACEELARETADGGPALLLGLPWLEGDALYNAYALLDGGVIQAVRFKAALIDGGARDETRSFTAGPLPGPVLFRDRVRLGLPIGDDLAGEEVVECLAETGAEILLSPAASLFRRGIIDTRLNVAVARVVESGLPLICLNSVGGQGDSVFDGASFGLDADRNLTHQLPAFREALVVMDWQREAGRWRCRPGEIAAIETGDEADYAACMLGLRDHVEQIGAAGVVIELSGGLDAALGAALAVDALGPERVTGLVLPSAATPDGGPAAAQAQAAALGIPCETVPVAALVEALETALADPFATAGQSSVEDDRVDRLRATVLGALAAGLGRMPMAPLDRTARAEGESGAGDLPGAVNPLADLYATEVFRLAALRNRWKPAGAQGRDGGVIPEALLAQPPDAQRDAILRALAEGGARVADLVAAGHDRETVLAMQRGAHQAGGRYPASHAFVDTGEPAHIPDAALVKGVGRAGGESIDF